MDLSGIWDSYHYDASHTIRELGCYINTIKIENLSLVCTLATRLSTSSILRIFTTNCDPGGTRTHDFRIKSAML